MTAGGDPDTSDPTAGDAWSRKACAQAACPIKPAAAANSGRSVLRPVRRFNDASSSGGRGSAASAFRNADTEGGGPSPTTALKVWQGWFKHSVGNIRFMRSEPFSDRFTQRMR